MSDPTTYREDYDRYIHSPKWAKRKVLYFNRHEKKCAGCGTEESVELHHRTYARMGAEIDPDLVPLCTEHHALVHQFHRRRGGSLSEATDEAIRILRRRLERESSREVKVGRGSGDPFRGHRRLSVTNNGTDRRFRTPEGLAKRGRT